MTFLIPFIVAILVSGLVTPLVRKYAIAKGIVDKPDHKRKIHEKPVAYLGGVAIFLGFLLPTLYFLPLTRQLIALLLGVTILVTVGVIDDMRGLSPWLKLAWQIIAACVVLGGGIGIVSITNPFGGVVNLNWGRFAVDFGSVHFHISPIANLLTIIWMVGMVNVINFLDGLDGLAGGVSAIAALSMFVLSLKIAQPETAILAIILAGAALGFLPFNWFPAKIFMGDGGAYFLGITLALLAIYSGGKLATASLVLGFTIFDGIWVATRRILRGTSPFKADRMHFHHLLISAGFSQRQAVLTLYAISALFGFVAVYAGSFGKLIGLVVLFLVMTTATSLLMARSKRNS